MIQPNTFPPVEFPDKPIPMEEAIAAEREVIAAKRAMAEWYERVGQCYATLADIDDVSEHWEKANEALSTLTNSGEEYAGKARILQAEARSQEIQLHNNLFQAGQLHARMQQQSGLIQVPGLVKQ